MHTQGQTRRFRRYRTCAARPAGQTNSDAGALTMPPRSTPPPCPPTLQTAVADATNDQANTRPWVSNYYHSHVPRVPDSSLGVRSCGTYQCLRSGRENPRQSERMPKGLRNGSGGETTTSPTYLLTGKQFVIFSKVIQLTGFDVMQP